MTTRRQITTVARTKALRETAVASEPPLRLILAAVALGMLVSTLFG